MCCFELKISLFTFQNCFLDTQLYLWSKRYSLYLFSISHSEPTGMICTSSQPRVGELPQDCWIWHMLMMSTAQHSESSACVCGKHSPRLFLCFKLMMSAFQTASCLSPNWHILQSMKTWMWIKLLFYWIIG